MSRTVVTMTLPPPVIELLDEEAERQYRSRSSLASQILAEGLAARNASDKQDEEVSA